MAQDQSDAIEVSWLHAGDDSTGEEAFLRDLSCSMVLTILMQPAGPGAADPGKNLALWKDEANGDTFVPVFTRTSHLTIPVLAPATIVRVPMRVLLATGGDRRYIINPLSSPSFELDAARVSRVREFFAARGLDPAEPSLQTPWAFRFPEDSLFPVAVALATWFNIEGEVYEAYLYELTRGSAPPVTVLGLNHELDLGLAERLKAIAVEAGADRHNLEVRFLRDEPSHRAGITGIKLAPFYSRPVSGRRPGVTH